MNRNLLFSAILRLYHHKTLSSSTFFRWNPPKMKLFLEKTRHFLRNVGMKALILHAFMHNLIPHGIGIQFMRK